VEQPKDKPVTKWYRYSPKNDDIEEVMYVYPHNDYIILGGTRTENQVNLEKITTTIKGIDIRCGEILNSLNSLKVKQIKVGARPKRETTFRVDAENIEGITVIHNYGHGGEGVCFFLGLCI